ncbi:MAG: chlorophyllase family protein [Ramlibacter sp.]|jgi:haloacetate dehalogenase|nr:chlorophyllase family protein [Ramlibacter sp.]
MSWFEGFDEDVFHVNGTEIFARFGGDRSRPALLLLHGFLETHAAWHRIAQRLKDEFFVVAADLRGYGDSLKEPGAADHGNYSKRTMAADMAAVMHSLRMDNFSVCGHDRGARVAHRLALDYPDAVARLCLIDVVPTLDLYENTSMELARHYFHWFFLIQPAPLPELMIGPNAKALLHMILGGWGAGGLGAIEPQAMAEYERCFCRSESIHASCEDFRASAGIDLVHDRESRERGDKIACDTLVLSGQQGLVHQLFDARALWQAQCAKPVDYRTLPCGHYMAEELPQDTALALRGFFL